MRDAIGALRDYLAGLPAIAALVETRVFVNRLPRETIEAEEDAFHPRKMLVIRQAGGAAKSDLMVTDDQSITVLCYGETDLEADRVRREVWQTLVTLSRVNQNGVLIHHVNPTGGAVPLVDPDIVWPAVAQNFSMKADVLEIA